MSWGDNWLAGQIWLFSAAVLAGLILDGLWTLYQRLWGGARRAKKAYYPADAAFALAALGLLLIYWFTATDGTWSFWSLLALALGWWLGDGLWPALPRSGRRPSGGRKKPHPARPPRPDPLQPVATRFFSRCLSQARLWREQVRKKQRRKKETQNQPEEEL